MEYRKLGRTDLSVSALCLGTMTFGQQNNEAEGHAQLDYAFSRGVNFLDTAEIYSIPSHPETQGSTERIVGSWLKARGGRDKVIVATKVAGRGEMIWLRENNAPTRLDKKNIAYAIEGSLRRLQTDYIDLYQVHGWDSNTPLEETLRTLNDLVRQGKVRYIGLSNLMSWQAATAVMLQERLGLEKYVTAQMYYSLVGRGLEYEFQSFAEYHNIGILVWSALAGGFLSGKYTRNNPAPVGTRFAEAGQFVPFDKENGYGIVDVLREVAKRHDASPARVALAWVLARPAVSSVIVAARKPEHLEDNISAVDLQLSSEDVRLLDEVSDPGVPYPKWMVLQLDTAEDPRPRVLHPEEYGKDGRWRDLRGSRWPG